MKIKAVIPLMCIILLLSACSRESRFGVEQFVSRINSDFSREMKTEDFLLSRDVGGNMLFAEESGVLLCLMPDSDGCIKGAGAMLDAGGDAGKLLELFTQICCVLTENDFDPQAQILKNCQIEESAINFADSSFTQTVGKYKYSMVSRPDSVTLFCERV